MREHFSLYEIEILIHFHCSYGRFSRDDAPGFEPACQRLAERDLLMRREAGDWAISTRGSAFVNSLKRVPAPEADWKTIWPND